MQLDATRAASGPAPATWISASSVDAESSRRTVPLEGTSRESRPTRSVESVGQVSTLRVTPQPSTSPRRPDNRANRSITAALIPKSPSVCAAIQCATRLPQRRFSRSHTSAECSKSTCGIPVKSLHDAPTNPPGTAQCDQTTRQCRASRIAVASMEMQLRATATRPTLPLVRLASAACSPWKTPPLRNGTRSVDAIVSGPKSLPRGHTTRNR